MARPLLQQCSAAIATALSLGCMHPATSFRVVTSDFARADSTTDSEWFATDSGPPVSAGISASGIRQLKVLTFNLWSVELPIPGFLFEVSHDIESRLKLLPNRVVETGADILVFQEVWREQRKLDLVERFRRLGFPYSIHNTPDVGALERGLLGNGLLIISRFPLSPVPKLLRFSRYTRDFEYFARKGAIETSVSVPGLGWVDLVDAHLGAVGTETENGRADHFNARDRSRLASQVAELVRFMNGAKSSRIVLAAMDMNTHYHVLAHGSYQPRFAPEYAMMTCAGTTAAEYTDGDACLGLTDTFRRVHGFGAEPAWTFDTRGNPYAGRGEFAEEPPGVLDYIFVNDNPRLVPVSSEIVFRESPRLSDHYGVVTTFEIRNGSASAVIAAVTHSLRGNGGVTRMAEP